MVFRAEAKLLDEVAEVSNWTDEVVSFVGQPPFHYLSKSLIEFN